MLLGIPPVFSERQLVKKRESVRCLTLWCNARYAKSAGGCGEVLRLGGSKRKEALGIPASAGKWRIRQCPKAHPRRS